MFIQLDGVPAPLLENEIRSGNIPTISRWVRSGTHTWTEWTARVPSTTPVSQAGLLHGNNDGIPAFRWYDRELGRLLVANRPEDAAIIEARVGNGRGLLADDGVSISNLFSGDAADLAAHDERAQGGQEGARTVAVVCRVLHAPGRHPARGHPDHRRDGQGGRSRPGARCGAGSSRGSTAAAPTSPCAR